MRPVARRSVVAFALLLAAAAAEACTGMYAGRRVTVDGTTLIGRTIDISPTDGVGRLARVPRNTRNGNRYSYICTPLVTSLGRGFFASAAVNERGFALSATVTAYVNAKIRGLDPYVPAGKGGVGEGDLPALIAGECATAREAVEFLARKVAARGSNSSDIYMFADAGEAWFVEVLTGHQWAAVRMPEDKVAVFGNEFMIREFDLNDKANAMHSPDLVKLAGRCSALKWIDEQRGVLDLFGTYSGGDYGDSPHYRTWFGHRMLAPSTAGEYARDRGCPLFFDPEPGTKISPTNFFEVMRTRYEGVNCPEENFNTAIRTIGTTSQHSCHVVQLRHDLPERYRGTLWYAPSKAQYSVFLPVNGSADEIDAAFARDQTERPYRYDPEIAGMEFMRLYTLARMREYVFTNSVRRVDVRPCFGGGVREHWRKLERGWAADWNDRLTRAAAADDAAGLTAYSLSLQRTALADARRMFDGLMWYACGNVRISGDGGGATDVPKEPYKP